MFASDYKAQCVKAGLKDHGEIEACSVVSNIGNSTIIVPNPCRQRGQYAKLLCHEMAHINKWPDDHGR